MNLSSTDVCRCPRSRRSGRRYLGWQSCLGCSLLIVDARTLRRLDSQAAKSARPQIIAEPNYWLSYLAHLAKKEAAA